MTGVTVAAAAAAASSDRVFVLFFSNSEQASCVGDAYII